MASGKPGAVQGVERDPVDQGRNADAVVTLAGQENKADQVSERVHERHDLGRQATARTSDGLTRSPPFAPVAC